MRERDDACAVYVIFHLFKSSGFAIAFSSATGASSSTSQPLTRLRVSSFDFIHVIVICSFLPVLSLCSDIVYIA